MQKHSFVLLFCHDLIITFRLCFCIFILTSFSFPEKMGKLKGLGDRGASALLFFLYDFSLLTVERVSQQRNEPQETILGFCQVFF